MIVILMNMSKEKMKKAAAITFATAAIMVGAVWMNKVYAEPKASAPIRTNKACTLNGTELLSRDSVVKCVSSFKNPEAAKILAGFANMANYTGSAEVMDAAANCISKFKHRPARAGRIAHDMGEVAFYTKSEYVVRRLAIILSHYGNTTDLGERIAHHIRGLAADKKGKDDNKLIRDVLKRTSMKTPGIPHGEWE